MKFLKFCLLFLMILVISCKNAPNKTQKSNVINVKKAYTYDEEQEVTFPYQLNLSSGVAIEDAYVTKDSCSSSNIIYKVSKDLKIKNHEIRCGKNVRALYAYEFKDTVRYFSVINLKQRQQQKVLSFKNTEHTFVLNDSNYIHYTRTEVIENSTNPFGKGFTKDLVLDAKLPIVPLATYQNKENQFKGYLN